MKNLQSYEEFLNEANELIKAQGACKNAIFQTQKEVDGFFNGLVKEGLLKKYSSKIKPYNYGYELKIDPVKEMSHETSSEVEEYLYDLSSDNSSIWIQPSTFFEENLLDDKYTANIETRVLATPKNKKIYDKKYPKFIIKSKGDIDKATKEFVKIIKDQISEIKDHIEGLKS